MKQSNVYAKALEAARIFLTPHLGLTCLDKQRNTRILDKLQGPYMVEDIIQYKRKRRKRLARMEHCLPLLSFLYHPSERRDMERQKKDEKTNTTFKINKNRS
jgi:hypothetical protein